MRAGVQAAAPCEQACRPPPPLRPVVEEEEEEERLGERRRSNAQAQEREEEGGGKRSDEEVAQASGGGGRGSSEPRGSSVEEKKWRSGVFAGPSVRQERKERGIRGGGRSGVGGEEEKKRMCFGSDLVSVLQGWRSGVSASGMEVDLLWQGLDLVQSVVAGSRVLLCYWFVC